ncbi:MAG: UvrD-helicase domain-containing protein [Chloroflexi bacterium]|jgi:hypothetical protein|nr:UvrD-helicase domain-containing protein [Chloroflexota bacterium]
MAVIYGQPGNEAGDQKVYEALKALPSESIVYAQPKLVYKSEIRYPDYIIVNKNWGVVVLEVKDWVQIQNINRNGLEVFRQSIRKWEYETCPVDQAKSAAFLLQNMLAEDKDLRNHAGKIDFSYAYGVVLPNLFGVAIQNCNYYWGEGYVLGMLDLAPDKISEKIKTIPVPFRHVMTENQVRATCAIIDPINKLIDRETGQFKGVLDQIQESITKEPAIPQVVDSENKQTSQQQLMNELFPAPERRIEHLEKEIPAEIVELKSNMHVRLIRGFAGTGKTDILILRALYLTEQNPKLKILVTTFNRDLLYERLNPELKHKTQIDVKTFDSLCSAIYKKRHAKWKQPQEVKGLLAWMAKNNESIDKWGSDFLADEFTWMKESGRTNREDYISKPRDGRGGENGKIFSKEQKNEIYNIFDQYQYELKENSSFDWADLHEKTIKYLDEGIEIEKKYDVILIDEAQHFAPCWMKIITHFLKEDGVLFLCDDPSQSVYRFFSWKQKGINVVGKTRWLKIPYRNTKQIFEAAFSLIKMIDLR